MDSMVDTSKDPIRPKRPKVGRPSEACAQCQKRKQKCNREWPCSNCQFRKVAHLCKFDHHTSRGQPRTPREASTIKQQSTAPGLEPPRDDDFPIGPVMSLKTMGYMDVEELSGFSVQHSGSKNHSPVSQHKYPREVEEALNAFPQKTLTDILVRHSLEMVDYVRVTLYPSQILDQYESWWPTRKSQLNLNFSSLVLRLCSLALQCLPIQLRQHIETELGDNAQVLTERYHRAAKQLSDFSDLGEGDLMHVQQLFLTAAWFKAEGFFSKAWHYLGAAIREAQELGIHRAVTEQSITEMDRELRRRIWCSFYTWDRSMSITLRRPYLIDESSCDVELPSSKVELDTHDPELPSPIVEQLLKYRAAHIMVQISTLKDKTDTNAISALLSKLRDLLESVPTTLKFNYSSPSLDERHPRLRFVRCKILLDIYASAFMLLKPILLMDTTTPDQVDSIPNLNSYRLMACSYGFRLIELIAHMVELFNPERSKDHQVVFTPFDTAMTLCVALKRNPRTFPLPKIQIVIAIGEAFRSLSQMESFSKLAQQGVKVLRELVGNLSLTKQENDIILLESLQQRDSSKVFQLGVFETIPASSTTIPLDVETQNLPALTSPVGKQVRGAIESGTFDHESVDFSSEPLDIEWREGIDLGVLDDMFHWDELVTYGS